MNMVSKALAEMGGAFALIFVGAGSIMLSEKHIVPAFCIPLAWGLMVSLMIIAVGHISGAHFNPAVTLAFAITKRIPFSEIWFYWTSQMIGGIIAASLLGALNK
ncbi:MAG TPA: aquaporin [Verrucomicrobiae bacterium]|jgi:aquaporin NIP|nr:aquaporin [Verrucomicrobiae bacterium]